MATVRTNLPRWSLRWHRRADDLPNILSRKRFSLADVSVSPVQSPAPAVYTRLLGERDITSQSVYSIMNADGILRTSDGILCEGLPLSLKDDEFLPS